MISNMQLNPLYTFENFITGDKNKQAYDACYAVAEQPGCNVYNPLFLYGKTGVGKTHLIQAIAHHIQTHNPEMKVIYITTEMFVSQLIDAISKNKTEEFKANYKQIDLMIIDDIQEIIGKERTQKELLNIVNYLYDSQIQMVFSSDRLPKEFFELDEGLRSRFMWGIPVMIPFPDYETCLSIIQKKAEMIGISDIQDDIASYLAYNISSDVRIIEGMLNKIWVYCKEDHNKITIEYVSEILKDFALEPPRITLEMILLVVAEYYEVSVEDIRSKKRKGNINQARNTYIYLGHLLTNECLVKIGYTVGRRDKGLLCNIISMIDEKKNNDIKFSDQLEEIISLIKVKFT